MHKKQIRLLAQAHGYAIYWTFLRHSRQWSASRRQAYIVQHLRQTLVRAYTGTRHYRAAFDAAGFNPERDFRGPEDLRRLPVLTKQMVRERCGDLIDRRHLAGA